MIIKINLEKNIIWDYVLAFMFSMSCIVLAYVNNTIYKGLIVAFCCFSLLILISQKAINKKNMSFFNNWIFFVMWCVISLLWAYDDNTDVLIVLFLIAVVCFSISVIIQTTEQVDIFIRMIVLASIILEIYLLLFYGVSIFTSRFDNDVLNSNRAGTIFALSMLCCVYLFYTKKQIWTILEALFLGMGVLISGSKSAILFAIVTVSVFFVMKNRDNLGRSLRNIMIVVILILIVFFLITKIPGLYNIIGKRFIDFLNNIFGRTVITSRSTEMREYLLTIAWDVFKKNPIGGCGVDNFHFFNYYNTYAHSNMFEILADLGLIGFILFYRIYYITIRKTVKNKNINEVESAFVWSYMLGMMLINFTGVYFNEMIDVASACLMYLFVATRCKGND